MPFSVFKFRPFSGKVKSHRQSKLKQLANNLDMDQVKKKTKEKSVDRAVTRFTPDVISENKLDGKPEQDDDRRVDVKLEESSVVITHDEIAAFYRLLEKRRISNFLERDSCYKISDKYLLIMAFVYFKRANLRLEEFTTTNFFIALYLANDMEEDDEEEKYEILLWAFGDSWRWRYPEFMERRDKLWIKMDYRAVVSLKTCKEYFSILPKHPAWERDRQIWHSGAKRYYGWNCDNRPMMLFGPHASPPICHLCYPPSDSLLSSGDLSWIVSDERNGLSRLPQVDIIFQDVDKDGDDILRYYFSTEE